MADRVEVVPLEEVSTPEVVALLYACLGPGAVERGEAFWRWKHEASPFGRSPGLVAMAGGRAVALRVFLRWRFAAADRTVHAVRAVDTATHPDWRRRGLFRRLTLELVERVRHEGAAFIFNTPNPRSRRGYLAMGWKDVGRAPLLVRLRRPVRSLRGLLGRARDQGEGSLETPPELRPVGELLGEPDLPALLAAWSAGERRLHTPRTPEYLSWRYGEAPGLSYGALWRLEGSSGAVVVARARRRYGLREVTLSELLASDDPEGQDTARALLRRMGGLADVDYLAALATPGTVERDLLREAGWLPVAAGPRWVVRPLRRATGPDPRDRRSWRSSAGDLELF